ncbi:hypothetical protein ABZP36_006524 [Zizania latifolia]
MGGGVTDVSGGGARSRAIEVGGGDLGLDGGEQWRGGRRRTRPRRAVAARVAGGEADAVTEGGEKDRARTDRPPRPRALTPPALPLTTVDAPRHRRPPRRSRSRAPPPSPQPTSTSPAVRTEVPWLEELQEERAY